MQLLLLLLALLLAALPTTNAACSPARLPNVSPLPAGFTLGSFVEDAVIGGGNPLYLNNGNPLTDLVLVQYETYGPVILMRYPSLICYNDEWYFEGQNTVPVRASVATPPADLDPEAIVYVYYADGRGPQGVIAQPNTNLCPGGGDMTLQNNGRVIKSIQQLKSATGPGYITYVIYADNADWFLTLNDPATVTCGPPKPTTTSTTTSTSTTTTTVKPDTAPTAAQLWDVNYYYNYGVGVHAYCADNTCINAIQSNGIGYDMVNGKGLLGRAVTEAAIAAVRLACPTGSQNLRNLGFTKSGNKYLHNFAGTGLKQGWVSLVSGACGARSPVKRWKSRYTDDMMYGENLEWNTWYQGMVQDGGKVQFYMWA